MVKIVVYLCNSDYDFDGKLEYNVISNHIKAIELSEEEYNWFTTNFYFIAERIRKRTGLELRYVVDPGIIEFNIEEEIKECKDYLKKKQEEDEKRKIERERKKEEKTLERKKKQLEKLQKELGDYKK